MGAIALTIGDRQLKRQQLELGSTKTALFRDFVIY